MSWRTMLALSLMLHPAALFASNACNSIPAQALTPVTALITQSSHAVKRIRRPDFCEHTNITFDGTDSCAKHNGEYLRYFSQCLDTYRMSDPQSLESLLVRRKELEHFFDLEAMLLSRIAHTGKEFDARIAAFQKKWSARLSSSEAQYMDNLDILKPELRGQLKARLNHLPRLKTFLSDVNQDTARVSNFSQPLGINLIEAAVFLEATKSSEKGSHSNAHTPSNHRPNAPAQHSDHSEHSEHGTSSVPHAPSLEDQRDLLYAYYPELELDSNALKDLLGLSVKKLALDIAGKTSNLPSVTRSLVKMNSVPLEEKMAFLNQALGIRLDNKAKADKATQIRLGALETHFLKAMETIQKRIDTQIEASKTRNWKALNTPITQAAISDLADQRSEVARALQTQACKNAAPERRRATFEYFEHKAMPVLNALMVASLGSGALLKGGTKLAAVGGRAALAGAAMSKTAVALGRAAHMTMPLMYASYINSEAKSIRLSDDFAKGLSRHSALGSANSMRNEMRLMMLAMPLMKIPGIVAGHGAHGAHASTVVQHAAGAKPPVTMSTPAAVASGLGHSTH